MNASKYLIYVLIALFVSSCTIQKRRYSKGFYTSWHKKVSATSVNSNNSPQTDNENTEIEETNPEIATDETNLTDIETNITQQNDAKEDYAIESKNEQLQYQEEETIIPLDTKIQPDTRTNESSRESIKPNNTNKADSPDLNKENKKERKKLSKRQLAIIIGISILLMAIIAGIAFPIIENIFVLGNPTLTGINMANGKGSFLLSIIGWIAIFILDLMVSWGLIKKDRKEKTEKRASLSGITRFIYSLFLGAAIVQLFLAHFASSALSIYNFLNSFYSIWGLGLIVFGVHLILLGISFQNKDGKKWLTILIKALLIIAGIGYLIQYIGILFVANPIVFAASVESIFIAFMILGEITYAIWMLIKGGKK